MQSATNTQFKQKKCPQCGNNHDNDGILCSFCIEKEVLKRKKIQQSPADFWVKCLIEREGDTVLSLGNIRYTFRRNASDEAVCEIINQGHYNQIIKSEFYEPYIPEEAEDEPEKKNKQALFSDEDADFIDLLHIDGKKVTEIAKELSDLRGTEITWQRVSTYLKSK